MEQPKITHKLYIAGKVQDVKIQLELMTRQFPNASVREMLDAYGLKEMILQ